MPVLNVTSQMFDSAALRYEALNVKVPERALQVLILYALVTAAIMLGIAVVLIAVPAPGLTLAPLPLYSEIAAEFGLPVDLETVADILGDRALKSDYIHPNAAGYRRLALAVADLLRAGGAIP